MSSSEHLYLSSSSSINDSFTEDQETICPYCGDSLSNDQLQYHLDTCIRYREVSNRGNSVRSRLFSALRDSLTLYRPWQDDQQSESWSYSSPESSYESLPSTPEFSIQKQPLKVSTATCPVCFDCFNSEELQPLILPKCGHTVCKKCLNHIVRSSTLVKCPVCRKINPTDLTKIPVNYALLDYSEVNEATQICSKHKLEIVGYCIEDSEVLCGACVMEHQSHECYALDDLRVKEIAESNKKGLDCEEEQLGNLKETWLKAQNELESLEKQIHSLADSHVQQFIITEKKICDGIKAGKKSCLAELQQICLSEEIRDIENMITFKLNCIQEEILKVRAKKEKFDELSVYDKLSRPKVLYGEDEKKVPSLGPLYKIVLKLQPNPDYKKSIKKHHLLF